METDYNEMFKFKINRLRSSRDEGFIKYTAERRALTGKIKPPIHI